MARVTGIPNTAVFWDERSNPVVKLSVEEPLRVLRVFLLYPRVVTLTFSGPISGVPSFLV